MKKLLLILICSILYNNSAGQCSAPFLVYNSNINHYNADVNWNHQNNIYNYKIRYKIVGDTVWSWKFNIDSLAISKNLNNLTPLNTYIWQIQSNCNDTGNYSQFSSLDTFYTSTSNCPNIIGLSTSNINYNEATANWMLNQGSNRYRIHYRIYGSSNWLNLAPVDSLTNSILLPLLQQNTTYEWEVMAYYDSTNQMASLWSVADTFTTTNLVLAPFNPIVMTTLSSLECNVQTELYLSISQAENEPDIGTGTIISDGGYFNINPISSGDSVGHATITTATQSITAILKAGIILGQNYAIINSYDSAGYLIGFFTIENDNGGVKIEVLGSPNDGNNHTSGYVSDLYFTNLFVTPQNVGPLHFFSDINSELSDQMYATDTLQIWCNNTSIMEQQNQKEVVGIYDLLGRKTKFKGNSVLIYKYSNGEIRKIITID